MGGGGRGGRDKNEGMLVVIAATVAWGWASKDWGVEVLGAERMGGGGGGGRGVLRHT